MEIYDAMRYNWTELSGKRVPFMSNVLLNGSTVGETDGTVFSNTLTI